MEEMSFQVSLEYCQGLSIPDSGGKFNPPARNGEWKRSDGEWKRSAICVKHTYSVPVEEAVVVFVAKAAALVVVPFLVPVTNSIYRHMGKKKNTH